MKLNHHLLVILFLAILLGSCEDNHTTNPTQNKPPTEEQLPPITTTGAGTFGCKVNGKVWVAKSNKTGWPPTYASISKHHDWNVNITGNIVLNNTKDVVIGITYFNTFSNHYPLYMRKDNASSAGYSDRVVNQQWKTDSIVGGAVTITRFDTINQIVSGTFFFDCVNKETNDTMHITEGRFDMHYTY
jgi:hypothetical protein